MGEKRAHVILTVATLVCLLTLPREVSAHHPGGSAWSGGSSSLTRLWSLNPIESRPWQLSLGYALTLRTAQPPSPGAREVRGFGRVWNQALSFGLGYSWGVGWSAKLQLPLGLAWRPSADPGQRRVFGLGDMRMGAQKQWWLGRRLAFSRPLRVQAELGLVLPTGRYKEQDVLQATYLEPDVQTGALGVRHVRAQAGLGGGVVAPMLGLSLSQRWHPRSLWAVGANWTVPVTKTPDGQRWGSDLELRALVQGSAWRDRLRIYGGFDFVYHGPDRWYADPALPEELALDTELAAQRRLSARGGVVLDTRSRLVCAWEMIGALFQRSDRGALVQTLQTGLSCQVALGRLKGGRHE